LLVLVIVKEVVQLGVADRLIARSPAVGLKLPRREREKVIPLSTEQLAALVDAVPQRYRAAVIVAAGSGLRMAELFGLTVDDVDFLRREIRVDHQLVSGIVGQEPRLGPPKTEASRRTIPVPRVVVGALSATWPPTAPVPVA
jgi:integrase